MKSLVFGEVLWDIFPDGEHIGGAPFNFAAHFKKCGGKSWVVTAVGNDLLGDKTIEEIKKLGVNTEYVSRVEYETGKCLVTLDKNLIPSYDLLNNVAYDFIKKPELKDENFDILYFGTLSLRNKNNCEVIKEIISENRFKDIFVDVNIRAPFYRKETIKFALENATILKISDEELPVVMSFVDETKTNLRECIDTICQIYRNIKLVIITKGDKGSVCFDSINTKTYECQSEKVKVLSTVGAGDSFSASFLSRYLKNNSIEVCLEFAAKVSGYVVSQTAAIPDYDLKDFE